MSLLEQGSACLLNVYKRFPAIITHGEGVWLFDENNNRYLDLLSGIAVNALGYNHPKINKALADQASKNLHLCNIFLQEVQVKLAQKLIELTPFSKVFYSNSGTEAIEGLLKLVKKWGTENNKSGLLSFNGSFHGRTLGAVSITGQEKYRKPFYPLLPNATFTDVDDIEAFNNAINEDIAAVFFEGISGEGGVRPVSEQMLTAIKEGREKYGYLIIVDEIQTGVGRSGQFYYFEQFGFVPDAIASAKGLGGGLPLGAFLVNEKLENVFNVGEHGTTYGGNPLACATGLAVVEEVSKPAFLAHVRETGAYFKEKLQILADRFPNTLKQVRGQGLMLGVQVASAEIGNKIWQAAIEDNLIFNLAGGGIVLRFVPPLIIEREHIDLAIEKLENIIQTL